MYLKTHHSHQGSLFSYKHHLHLQVQFLDMEAWRDETANDDEEELLDYRTSAKDALILLCDASSPMHVKQEACPEAEEEETGGTLTPFEMALKVAHATLRNKVFHAPNDLVGVILFGTAEAVGVTDFKHISQLLPLDTAEAQHILQLEEFLDNANKFKEEFGGSSSDFSLHEAIWQCQTMFANIKGKTGQNKIMLLTCEDDPHASAATKKRHAMAKATDLNNTGIYLDVVPIGKGFRMDKFYKDLVQLADDEHPLDDTPGAERIEDLLRVTRKRIHKKRSIGRVRYFIFLQFNFRLEILFSGTIFPRAGHEVCRVHLQSGSKGV